MSEVYNWMPLITLQVNARDWVLSDADNREEMIQPIKGRDLYAWPWNKAVGIVGNQCEDLIAQVQRRKYLWFAPQTLQSSQFV